MKEKETHLEGIHGNVVEHARKYNGGCLLQQTKATDDIARLVAQRRKEDGHDDSNNDRLENPVEVQAFLTECVDKGAARQDWEGLAKVGILRIDLGQLSEGMRR